LLDIIQGAMPPVTAALLQAASALKEAGNRVLGLPAFVAGLAGAKADKKLRLRVVILRDGDGNAVASEDEIRPAVIEAQRVLGGAGIAVVPAGPRPIETLVERAPPEALDPPCADQGLWRADLGPAGDFFRKRIARHPAGTITGYGAPITVFVVRDVRGKCGCSLGPLGDYVTIDRGGLSGRTKRILAHELGHSCGLPHSKERENLMWPSSPGERLSRVQRAVFRSSRHVTYL
jgi:hypothetical protein